MGKIALTTGAYEARSLIANAQRAINLYPELNPEDSPFPMTHYPTPGLPLFSEPIVAGTVRGGYEASNGEVYQVTGSRLEKIDAYGNRFLIGTIASTATTPVSMSDNGYVLVLVDGSTAGYAVDLTDVLRPMSAFSEPGFRGSVTVKYLDTFFVFNEPDTRNMYISKSLISYAMVTGGSSIDPLDIVAKSGGSDLLTNIAVVHREIWLVGQKTGEIFQNTGAADFTFGSMPGVFIQHGTVAPYSLAQQDLQLFWLGRDDQGQSMVLSGEGYQAKRVSSHAMENAMQAYTVVSDAQGMTYQQGGHIFYILTFPTANATWVYDVASKLWHQRCALDSDGNLNRTRANCVFTGHGKILVGDHTNGRVYTYDLNYFQEDGYVMPRIRGCPHLQNEDKRVSYSSFIADVQVGTLPGVLTSAPPNMSLRWSDDRGLTWGNPIEGTLGSGGQYNTSVKWTRLGLGRGRVFEMWWNPNSPHAINGAYIEIEGAET